jgi:O-Antigen ligase
MSGASIGTLPRLRARRGSGAGTLLGGAIAAGMADYLLFHGPLLLVLAFSLLPLAVWLLSNPLPVLVLLGAAIPITNSLTGGRGGFNVSPSDLLLVFLGAILFFQAVIAGPLLTMRALRPVKRTVMQYSVFLVLLLLVHPSVKDAAQVGQRFELFALPLVIGAFAALTDRHMAVLKAYVVSASVLAVLWPFAHGLGQKNPVGQMIANAILLLVGVKALRRYTPLALALAPGLILTGSRGAVAAAGIGILVILALQDSRARILFARVSVIALLAFGAYAMLPTSLQSRLTTFNVGTGSSGAYSLYIRKQYAADAYSIIKSHPFTGIGVGSYYAGNSTDLTGTTDPHDVLLLQAAEGGYAFAVSFALLVGATALALRKMRSVELAPVAAAILLATLAHGLFDVYWVRGTPVLSWLLVGMVCGSLIRSQGSKTPQPKP